VGLLAGLLVAALIFSIIVYRRERMLRRGERVALGVLRLAVLALLLLVLWQPVANILLTRSIRPHVLVLADASQSMNIRDTRKDPADLAEAAMALGRIEFENPRAYDALHQARESMRQAATALRRNQIQEAREHQRQADESLARLESVLQQGAPDGNLSVRLDQPLTDMRSKQKMLAEAKLMDGAEDLDQLAQQQQALAEQARRFRSLLDSRTAAVSDDLKEQLSLVPRLELSEALLQADTGGFMAEVSDEADVHTFAFGDRLQPVEPGDDLLGEQEQGEPLATSTQLGTALQQAVDRYSGLPVAGVVVFSDGAWNAGLDPLSVSARLGQQGIGVYPVGVGLASPDDLSLRAMVAQEVVFSGDLVPVRVQVLSSGYENRSTLLSVLLDGEEVARKTIVLTGKPQLEELSFKLDAASGMHRLAVTIQSLGDEAVQENNRLERSVRVVDEKIRVLCIEGSPRWEYRYLRAILKRDPRIEATFLTTEGDRELARASKEHIARFPEDPAEAFKYDLIILGDVRATTFTPAQLERMEQLVFERGGSLILLAGPKHIPAEYVNTPIDQMMPVWPESGEWEEVSQDVYPVLTEAGRESTVMQLETSESLNKAAWAKVKPLTRVPAVTSAKHTAEVLAVLSDSAQRGRELPLIAWHRYGAGKVMFVGSDRLWRLRAKVGDEYHVKFWSQAIQFLTLSRLLGENSRISFAVSRKEVAVGQPVEIYAGALSETYEPASGPSLVAEIDLPGQGDRTQRITLRPVPNTPGFYHGLYTPQQEGGFVISAEERDRDISNTVQFTALMGAQERQEAAMQRQTLEKMAELSGGRYFSIRELPLLGASLEGIRTELTSAKQIELWDTWVFPILFVLLAGIEWTWRRRKDMA
jgi:uncharacterized membrane protein